MVDGAHVSSLSPLLSDIPGLRLKVGQRGAAWFSDDADETYRYGLWRPALNNELIVRGWGTCCFCMLNPSTADQDQDDNTIRRCKRFAHDWGYANTLIVNAFALRSTDPAALLRHPLPIGEHNDAAILAAATRCDIFVCGWGVHGSISGRGAAVLDIVRAAGVTPLCIGKTNGGEPRHPLYLPKASRPVAL
jgi:hypothetical protein